MGLTRGIKILLKEANEQVETFQPDELSQMIKDGADIQLIDIRDIRELWREGQITNAYHAPRGMLEFWADPDSPYHKEIFATDKQIVLYCAAGSRSVLAAKTLLDMGMTNIAHLGGGFGAWSQAGLETETVEK